jgi:hypothetical protein
LRETVLTDGKIKPADLEMLHLTDDVDEAVEVVRAVEQSHVPAGGDLSVDGLAVDGSNGNGAGALPGGPPAQGPNGEPVSPD